MGKYNPDIAVQEIANDVRLQTSGRLIVQGTFQASGAGGSTYTAGGVGTAMYVPVDFGAGGTIDSMSINVTTLAATSQYRLALYARSTTATTAAPFGTSQPGGLVLDFGALDVTATGVKVSTAAAVKVAGVMYVLCSPQGSGVAVISGAATGAQPATLMTPYLNQATAVAGLFTANNVGYAETTSVTAAPPAVATVTGLSAGATPILVWRWTARAPS